ncbi:MAG: polymerase LigD, ligase domain protein [Verrucomicrobiaceae bacterium]|nr:polymerase LigD, ligase domain protein [Verrucomicrobiaceae bacterium]
MSLKEYQRKRDFTFTKEPDASPVSKDKGGCRFVIQKHDASRLHYDFRVEMGGALVSWAVPKGVPYAKGERHLAVKVEDHPLAYIDFEGIIPAGQYGGGSVMVWDIGTYEPLSKTPAKDLAAGKLHVLLHGKKLKGEWYFVRLRDEDQWLLIKGGEDQKKLSKKAEDCSAVSGKTMAQIAGDKHAAEWQSHKAAREPVKKPPARARKSATAGRQPDFIEPMKAVSVEEPPKGSWLYEIKFDGIRAIAFKHGGEVRLLSRTNKDLAARFPQVVEALQSLRVDSAIIDGEVVALNEHGVSSFQLLQAQDMGEEPPALCFYAFDILAQAGKSLQARPLEERREQLQEVLRDAPEMIRYSASLGEDAGPLMKKAAKLGLEGLIGKRKDSVYEAGRRTGTWIKLKLHRQQEFVIGGYTPPSGSRSHFGALLLGVYDNGKLRYCGKVGTGFNSVILRSLHGQMKDLERSTCPFSDLPEKREGRYGQGITSAVMKRCHWLKPELVCQCKFAEWTRDDRLRQPVYLGLREDKPAKKVVRETTL